MNIILKEYIGKDFKTETCGNIIRFEVSKDNIKMICSHLYHKKSLPLKTIVAVNNNDNTNEFFIRYVFGLPKKNCFLVPYIRLTDSKEFPSLIEEIHEAAYYERDIKTFFGLDPVGHLDKRPTHLHENWPEGVYPLRKDFQLNKVPEIANREYLFKQYGGEGIYEIPVGPIHAGIIEPGHFRFSVAGEEMMTLEPRLGYTHKGSEKLFEILPIDKKIKLSERISGDSSFSHSLAFCQALENLSEISVPERGKYLRVIYAEMERIANHIGDMGAILGDTGFNIGKSIGDYLREMIMQWNEKLTGSRFLRGVNTIGGVKKDKIDVYNKEFDDFLNDMSVELSNLLKKVQHSASVLNRLETTGILNKQIAKDHGVIGVAAKAIGLKMDARVDYPYAAYADMPIEIPLRTEGDVFARFEVRGLEIFNSIKIIKHALGNIPSGNNCGPEGKFQKSSCSIGLVEGWRGDIVYFVETDEKSKISRVKVRDTSFLNWSIFPYVVKNNIVPDFPLINKSFNLSYSGNDL